MNKSLLFWASLQLAVGGAFFSQEAAAQAVAISQSAVSRGVVGIQALNSTTVELYLADSTSLTLDFYGDNIVRIFQDPDGGIVRDPQATPPAQILVSQPRKPLSGIGYTLTKNSKGTAIKTACMTVQVEDRTSLITIYNDKGELVLRQTAPFTYDKHGVQFEYTDGRGHYYYGGGVQNGRFSHAGKAIAIENTNNWVDGGVASPTPFFWSTAGYSMLWHTFTPGRYDFTAVNAAEPRVKLSHKERYLDLFVSVNETPTQLLNDFYQLTGKPVLLPKFGFYQGHLNAYNRDYWTPASDGFMLYEDGKRYNESQKDNGGIRESLNGELGNYQFSARAAIDRYLKNDMPLGWFLPNDGYGAGYGQTNSLDGNIANLREFGDYARRHGVEIGLWTQSDLHPKPGIEPLLQRDIVKEVRDAGVRVLKTDVAWVGAGYSFGLNGVADVAQIMPYYGQDARPFIISLDGWAGTQRYAGIWSGDQTGGEWEYIRFHIPTFIGSGLSGQPNISSDTDGIFGGKQPVVNVREFQWKTFNPMGLNMDGWGTSPKYPEVMGEPYTSINRWYLKMKAELMPYTYSIAREAIDGKPMIRAMFLDYPNAYTLGTATQYQYLYGGNFLIAPIYQATKADAQGNDVRHGIYLPEGEWIDYFNGQRYAGGRIINDYAVPLWKLPIFVKAGAIIPMTHPHNTPNQVRPDYRAYEIYPTTASTSFVAYDDDGRTQAYLRDEGTTTVISSYVNKDVATISVAPTQGSYQGYQPNQVTELRINMSQAPKRVEARVGKQKVKLTAVHSQAEFDQSEGNVYFYNPAPNLNRFATKGSPFEQERIVKNPQLYIKLAKIRTDELGVEVKVRGFRFAVADELLKQTGSLTAPMPHVLAEGVKPRTLTLSWSAVEQADYYEVRTLADSMIHSTIRGTDFTFDGLTPATDYAFEVRAVNASGTSAWTALASRTANDPLEHAIKGAKAITTCANQGGSDVDALVDGDEKTMWHTAWNAKAVPFDLTIDLRGVAQVDSIVYIPRDDVGNGTLLRGAYSLSIDKATWSEPVAFVWQRTADAKCIALPKAVKARYVRFHITEAVGNFGSGRELYVFKTPRTEYLLQGDINKDKRIDSNDLTSYMNYTGLRRGDADFDYVSAGDVNGNGLIDAFDIAQVAIQLDGGAKPMPSDSVAGSLVLTPSVRTFAAGETVEVLVRGNDKLAAVNALSFALPYDASLLEYVGVESKAVAHMENFTYDRLHSNGTKVLYPTFVNIGNAATLSGTAPLFILKFKAKRAGSYTLKSQDGLLVDKNLGSVSF